MPDDVDFPLTIEAVQARDGSLWTIGDALIKEIGPPPKKSIKDNDPSKPIGVAAKSIKDNIDSLFEQCAKKLFIQGFPAYTTDRLRRLRDTAARFDVEQRREIVSFEAHRDIGSPEKLDEIVEAVKTNEKSIFISCHVCIDFVLSFL